MRLACALGAMMSIAAPAGDCTFMPRKDAAVDATVSADALAHGRIEPSGPAVTRFVQTGKASWYGDELAGRPTASGEIFDPQRLTAAHRDLPMGTTVEVTNLANGRSIIVEINDRGPFIEGRVIDLSHRAADELGFTEDGITQVRIEIHDAATAAAAGQVHDDS